MNAADLVPGDRFLSLDVPVEVLREREPWLDPFGRRGHFRCWCRREDTGAEGWMHFGPDGAVDLLAEATP